MTFPSFSTIPRPFSHGSASLGKASQAHTKAGMEMFSSGIRMLDSDDLQNLHHHYLVPSIPALAADSPPRCSGLDFSVTKCFLAPITEEHRNPVKGQYAPSFQCIFMPSILGIYFQIFLYGHCKRRYTSLEGDSQYQK